MIIYSHTNQVAINFLYMFNFNKSVGETVRISVKKVGIDFSPVEYSNYTIIKKVVSGNKFKYTIKNDTTTRTVQSYS